MRPEIFRAIRVNSWDEARSLSQSLPIPNWAFRGQENASWGLKTKLERVIDRYEIRKEFISYAEEDILESFQRRAHQYLRNPPSRENKLEWVALIQHYCGPTRLLDFTRSFYIAAFFATENATDDAAIWAVNVENLKRELHDKVDPALNPMKIPISHKAYTDYFNAIFGKRITNPSREILVVPAESWRMNERSAIQQGLFLWPLDLKYSFQENLARQIQSADNIFQKAPIPYDIDDDTLTSLRAIKIILPKSILRDVLIDLNAMNVTATTLFPGLDGFARSMQYEVSVYNDEIFRADTNADKQ